MDCVARRIDISAVRTDATREEIKELAQMAEKYHFICTFAMPAFTPDLLEYTAGLPDTMVGGVVGFPSGADTTSIKVATAKELLRMGVDELDMVIHVGAMKSGYYDRVRDDIKAVVDVADGMPVKAILEIAYLTDDEIAKASLLAVEAGVSYVKTGTGWTGKPTTVKDIQIIHRTIGNSAKIKAAGGIRDLNTVMAMVDAGCSRFGIGIRSAEAIMKETEKYIAEAAEAVART